LSLSTSSFRRTIPVGGGYRLVVLSLLTAVVPLIAVDLAIRRMGFLYAPKTPLSWYNLATREPPEDCVSVGFYGSSRVNLGFSPQDFDDQVAKLGGRTRSLNLALDGHTAGLGALLETDLPFGRDILIMELLAAAPLSEMEERTLEKVRRAVLLDRINNRVGIWLDRHMVLHRFRTVVAYELGHMTTRRFIYHDNGWNEAHYDDGGFRIERVIERRRQDLDRHLASRDASNEPPDPGTVQRWQQFAAMLQQIRDRQGCAIVIVRMPIGSLADRMALVAMERLNPLDVLANIPGVLIIDGNTHPEVSGFHAADESHLTAAEARRFSRALARVIYPWYEKREGVMGVDYHKAFSHPPDTGRHPPDKR